MSEDEKKQETQDEAPEKDETQDEGTGDAGPVGAGDPPPPAVAEASSEEVPPAPPPASEESESDDAAPAEESTAPAEEQKAAEAPAAEPSPEDELPWKERRRLRKSRSPRKAKPQRSTEQRKAERAEARKHKAELRRKQRADAKGKKGGGTGTPPADRSSVAAKVRQGVVVSDRAEKSITVRVDIVRRHPTYEKVIRRSRTLHAHDERNEAGEGDVVRVVETRPLSKTKRWRLVEILEKAK